MLTIGDIFPSFNLKGVVSSDPKTAFKDFSADSHKGKMGCVLCLAEKFYLCLPN